MSLQFYCKRHWKSPTAAGQSLSVGGTGPRRASASGSGWGEVCAPGAPPRRTDISTQVPSPEGTSPSVLNGGARANPVLPGGTSRVHPSFAGLTAAKKLKQGKPRVQSMGVAKPPRPSCTQMMPVPSSPWPRHSAACQCQLPGLCGDRRRWYRAHGGGHCTSAGTSHPWEVTALETPHAPPHPVPPTPSRPGLRF